MNVRALPAGLRRFVLDDVVPEPWRNGGGWTRTVATAASGAGGTTPAWRVSAADISHDGDFSVFDGIDRTAVLMDGPGLTLTNTHAAITFGQLGNQASFPGEAALQARLGRGPARLWNVMVDRSRWYADVWVHSASAGGMPCGAHAVLLVLSGTLLAEETAGSLALSLTAGEGLVLTEPTTALHLRAQTPDTRWIHTALRPL
jgi:environmental stress-induced protein Ves